MKQKYTTPANKNKINMAPLVEEYRERTQAGQELNKGTMAVPGPEFSGRIQSLEAEIRRYQGRIAAAEGETATLKGTIDTLKEGDRLKRTEINALKEENSLIKAGLRGLEDAYGNVRALKEECRSRISALE